MEFTPELSAREYAARLKNTRQESIDKFLSIGGQLGNGKTRYSKLELRLKSTNSKCYPSKTNFTKNAKILTHPLYMVSLSHRTPKKSYTPISIDQAIMEICSDKLLSKMELNPVNYSTPSSSGITTFSLDHEGALLAVGHKSGFFSLYDVDEINIKMMDSRTIFSKNDIKPILNIDTKKCISEIVWRKSAADDVLLSFTFSPEVCLYNLSEVDPESPYNPPFVKFVPDGKGTNSCGHQSMILWERKVTVKSRPTNLNNRNQNNTHQNINQMMIERKEEYIIAASTNGYLRCWKIPDYNIESNQPLIQNTTLWNIRNDMSRPIALARPIIGLFLLEDQTKLLAITDEGLFTIWDLIHLQTASFGSMGSEPPLISSFTLTDKLLCYSSPSIPVGTSSVSSNPTSAGHAITSRLIQKVIIHSRDPNNHSDIKELLILLEDGNLFLYHLLKKELSFYQHQYDQNYSSSEEMIIQKSLPYFEQSLPNPPPPAPATTTSSTAIDLTNNTNPSTISSNNNNLLVNNPPTLFTQRLHSQMIVTNFDGLTELLAHRNAQNTSFFPDICPMNIHSMSSSSSSSSSSSENNPPSHYFLTMYHGPSKQCTFQSFDLTTEYLNPFTHYSMNQYCHQQILSPFHENSWSHVIESSLLRSPMISYTLPGFIIEAIPGEKEILFSQNLIHYLGNVILIANSLSKTADIRIEYYQEEPVEDVNEENGQTNHYFSSSFIQRKLISQDYTIDNLRSNYLILTTPYQGPLIINGTPKVWIRANLIMKGFAYDSSFYHDILRPNYFIPSENRHNNHNFNRHWPMKKNPIILNNSPAISMDSFLSSSNIVKLFAHPFYPLVFLGHQNGGISVVSYGGYYNATDEEEKNSPKVFKTNQVVHYPKGWNVLYSTEHLDQPQQQLQQQQLDPQDPSTELAQADETIPEGEEGRGVVPLLVSEGPAKYENLAIPDNWAEDEPDDLTAHEEAESISPATRQTNGTDNENQIEQPSEIQAGKAEEYDKEEDDDMSVEIIPTPFPSRDQAVQDNNTNNYTDSSKNNSISFVPSHPADGEETCLPLETIDDQLLPSVPPSFQDIRDTINSQRLLQKRQEYEESSLRALKDKENHLPTATSSAVPSALQKVKDRFSQNRNQPAGDKKRSLDDPLPNRSSMAAPKKLKVSSEGNILSKEDKVKGEMVNKETIKKETGTKTNTSSKITQFFKKG